MTGKKASYVNHGDHVALCQERNQYKVRDCGRVIEEILVSHFGMFEEKKLLQNAEIYLETSWFSALCCRSTANDQIS